MDGWRCLTGTEELPGLSTLIVHGILSCDDPLSKVERERDQRPRLPTEKAHEHQAPDCGVDVSRRDVSELVRRTTTIDSTSSNPPNNLHAAVVCSAAEPNK
jgi:hypothetical protein